MNTASGSPTISLIISTYNRPQALYHVLQSVRIQKEMPHEVIVADDGSGEETRQVTEQCQKDFPVPLIHAWQEDLGFRQAANKNHAASKASGSYLLFLDGDLVMHPDYIKDNRMTASKGYFVVNTRVMLDETFTEEIFKKKQFSISASQLSNQKNSKNGLHIPWLGSLIPTRQKLKPCRGGLMGIWREDFVAVNGMNEDFVGWGHEDTDLFIRLFNYGLKRHNNKFRALTYHLYHPIENTDNAHNNKALAEKMKGNSSYFCPNGLDKYLTK
ncbi:glycosyltransferase family 2 protein [Carboxylicivirga sediminis]|uniref:Glycosyltransferase family 2 protein n=1 Tax=Carboxylicivirga sediminis TaxID=2006564 RepID=A0A941F5S9_9BACT|nr:glycosyltransferase family 2 protein [Carboxylicivirga sediminis]MBR8537356.1 glycosyltransferase family 2 protein [Carboxylicivirga sediminis]